MGKYFDELKRSMEYLADFNSTIFIGQAVECPGTALYNTIKDVDIDKRFEFPVTENLQQGIGLGLSLNGFVPISIFPRLDFLICSCDQLVNHLDKLPLYSTYKPHLIIRSAVGSREPLDPQHQHRNDYTEALQKMCQTINIIKLNEPDEIFPAYKKAYLERGVHLLIEIADYYNSK